MNLFNKNSSRAAFSINNMIVLAGSESHYKVAIDNKEQLEIIAKTEHLRWNGFLLANIIIIATASSRIVCCQTYESRYTEFLE